MTIPNTTAALIAFTVAAGVVALMVWVVIKIYREDKELLRVMRKKNKTT